MTEDEIPKEHGYCPACDADMDGGSIWWHFFREKGSEEEADKVSSMYGADRTTGRWGRSIAIIENDRCTAFECPECHCRWPRLRPN